ncbi:hypothetical protein FRC17_008113 [Serendipita sp. 399]|nr:hypothetical protein FRC17_008113 [Serendipita sp. 399]
MPLRIIVPEATPSAHKPETGPPNLYYRQLRAPMSEEDALTLRQMRLASGTYYDRIPTWIEEMALSHRLMWFIYLSPPTNSNPPTRHNSRNEPSAPPSASSPISPGSLSFILNNNTTDGVVLPRHASPQSSPTSPSSNEAYTQHHQNLSSSSFPPPIAMVCLLTSNPSDPSLASPHTARFELTSLWIYPLYRSHGIGVSIIKQMEYEAALRGAEYLTFNTSASGPDTEPPTPAGPAGVAGGSPTTQQQQQSNQTLKTFERMGYCEYKPREHRYSVNDVVNAGLPVQSTLAAFFEKYVGQRKNMHVVVVGRQHAHAHVQAQQNHHAHAHHQPNFAHAHAHALQHNHHAFHVQPRRQGSIGERALLNGGDRTAAVVKVEME